MKFGATRWLSKEVCINRVLKQYPSLRSYFASQPELRGDPRLRRLQAYFANPHTELYLLFLQSILPVFTEMNKVLQCEAPKIHVMLSLIQTFARKLLGRCIKAEALTDANLTSVSVDDQDNFLPADRVMIGFTTRSTMNSQDFLLQEKRLVAEHCRLFMVEAYKYAMSHLPVHDPVLQHAEVLQFDNRHTANFDSLVFFVEKFPSLKMKLEESIDIY